MDVLDRFDTMFLLNPGARVLYWVQRTLGWQPLTTALVLSVVAFVGYLFVGGFLECVLLVMLAVLLVWIASGSVNTVTRRALCFQRAPLLQGVRVGMFLILYICVLVMPFKAPLQAVALIFYIAVATPPLPPRPSTLSLWWTRVKQSCTLPARKEALA